MAHQAQHQFFEFVKDKYPDSFNKVIAIDCGSLDVNGSLKDLFTDSVYLGIDIVPGKNVDMVTKTHELSGTREYDTVVSAEMLEHDEYWAKSLKKMYDICKNGGLIAISAAGEGRAEHGTTRTGNIWGTSSDYYQNITEDMIRSVYKEDMFKEMGIGSNDRAKDIYFYGIKL